MAVRGTQAGLPLPWSTSAAAAAPACRCRCRSSCRSRSSSRQSSWLLGASRDDRTADRHGVAAAALALALAEELGTNSGGGASWSKGYGRSGLAAIIPPAVAKHAWRCQGRAEHCPRHVSLSGHDTLGYA